MSDKTSSIDIRERGVMLSDYFSGTSGVMLSVSLDKNTTVSEIVDSLEQEIGQLWDSIDHTAEHHNYSGDIFYDIKAQIAGMREYYNNGKYKGKNAYCPNLDFTFEETENDCDNLPVAIFSIEFID